MTKHFITLFLAFSALQGPAFGQEGLQAGDYKDQIREVQAAIKKTGARWTAGDSDVARNREDWKYLVGFNFEPVKAEPIELVAAAELPAADAVMMLRVQSERMTDSYFPTEREYSRRYGLDADRMHAMPEHAIVIHPGPMNRGVEITADVADSPRSVIVAQVTNGVSARMAVLYTLLGGTEAQ